MADDDPYDHLGYVCERCGRNQRALRAEGLESALDRARTCFAEDGSRIDRAHVEAVHDLLGTFALPLEARVAERARVARPELARFELLVAPEDATLVHPREALSNQLERLIELRAPDVVLDHLRDSIARWEGRDVHLDWERVHGWPSPTSFPGTVGFGVIARLVAAHTFEALVPSDSSRLLGPIDDAISSLRLGLDGFAARADLVSDVARAEIVGDVERNVAFRFAIRCLDELGHTGLLDNQDTLVDDAYFTLRHARRDADARAVFTLWLDVGVPAAVATIRGS